MKIDILCTDNQHPVMKWLQEWQEQQQEHDVRILHDKNKLEAGDILYLISCSQIISADIRKSYSYSLVIHASDLPQGRGWSPHIWQLLEGRTNITLSLINAEDEVDSGDIWAQETANIPPHALFDEINSALFSAEITLMNRGIELIQSNATPTKQEGEKSYHKKRTPEDSQLDPTQPLEKLFNQLRLADTKRYPAFFELHGHSYQLHISKVIQGDK